MMDGRMSDTLKGKTWGLITTTASCLYPTGLRAICFAEMGKNREKSHSDVRLGYLQWMDIMALSHTCVETTKTI